MDHSCINGNREELERLRAMVGGLTDRELARPLAGGWTVAAQLAHLAFWDRRCLEVLEVLERNEKRQGRRGEVDRINEEMLPQWLAMSPKEAVREVVDAAESVDRKVEGLSSELMETILSQSPLLIRRGLHRRDHLDEIERALEKPKAG